MPNAQLTNPKGAGYFDIFQNGALTLDFEINPDVEGNTPIGTLVELTTPYTGPGTGATPDVPLITPSADTADFLLVGAVVGGTTTNNGNGTSIAPGEVANVCIAGVCQILCDATTVAGDPLIQSAATAGAAKTAAAAVLAKTIGVALESVTIDEGTALVWCYIRPA